MSAIDELKSISTKKHVVTSIEYDCCLLYTSPSPRDS